MLKIGEFARLSKVSIKMLRHYDDIGLLRPFSVDADTGYRYYSADQLVQLNKILALKDCSFTLREIGSLLHHAETPERLIEELQAKEKEIARVIEQENERQRQIHWLIETIAQQKPAKDYAVILKEVEAIQIASVRGIVPDYTAQGPLWSVLGQYLGEHEAKIGLPCFVIYHDSVVEDGVDVEVAEPLLSMTPASDHVKVYTLPKTLMVSTVHRGSFQTIHRAYNALTGWLEQCGYRLAGPHRELYLKGEWATSNPEEYITEIQFPVAKQDDQDI